MLSSMALADTAADRRQTLMFRFTRAFSLSVFFVHKLNLPALGAKLKQIVKRLSLLHRGEFQFVCYGYHKNCMCLHVDELLNANPREWKILEYVDADTGVSCVSLYILYILAMLRSHPKYSCLCYAGNSDFRMLGNCLYER
jgi:hypothetical protein